MDVVGFGCTALRSQLFEQLMIVIGYFGHGSIASIIALGLLTHGYLYKDPRTRRAGFAVIVAIIVAGTAAQALKDFIQLPRPKLKTGYGFPSGHEADAFSLAAVLASTFPAISPLFYLLAVLTGLSRLYLRAHFTWDVIGGTAIGLMVGVPVGRKLISPALCLNWNRVRLVGWILTFFLAAGGLLFFNTVERNIEAYMLSAAPADKRPATTFDFGTPQARKFLHDGWSEDELWDNGKQSVVWANGLKSALAIELPSARDYRFRLTAFPYAPRGPACQRVEIKLNRTPIIRIILEQGWHAYEFNVPRALVNHGKNDLEFAYDYADSPQSRAGGSDLRTLSVAFDKLEIF
jgi:hypothetical protein